MMIPFGTDSSTSFVTSIQNKDKDTDARNQNPSKLALRSKERGVAVSTSREY